MLKNEQILSFLCGILIVGFCGWLGTKTFKKEEAEDHGEKTSVVQIAQGEEAVIRLKENVQELEEKNAYLLGRVLELESLVKKSEKELEEEADSLLERRENLVRQRMKAYESLFELSSEQAALNEIREQGNYRPGAEFLIEAGQGVLSEAQLNELEATLSTDEP